MASSFHVPCPSCEANVLVKNSGMIGKKIDCTKCKYRFTVSNPDEAVEDDTAVAEVDAGTKKKKKGSPMLLVGVVLGVLAVGLLGYGAMTVFSDAPKPTPQKQPQARAITQPVTPQTTSPSTTDVAGTGDPMDPTKVAAPMLDPSVVGKIDPKVPEKIEAPVAVAAGQLKDATNMLPNDTQALLRFNMDRLTNTPFYSTFFDNQTRDFFRKSMKFEAGDISMVLLALVGPDRDPFVLIRTKAPVSTRTMMDQMDLERGAQSPMNGRPYSIIKSNAFISAISRTLSSESLLGQTGMPVTDEDKKRWQEKPIALNIYDSQTIIIGEVKNLERWLSDLTKEGLPPYLSELTPNEPPPPAPGAGPMASGMGPMGSGMGPMGMPPMGSGSSGMPPMGMPPMGMPPMGGQPGAAPPKPKVKLFTSIPTYRTVKPELKRMLNRLEEDDANPVAVLYADMLDQRVYNRDFRSVYDSIGAIVTQIVDKTKVMGIAITKFQKDKVSGMLAFDFVSAEDAKTVANEQLAPILNLLKSPLGALLGAPIEVKNNAGDGSSGGSNSGGSEGPMGPMGRSGGPGARGPMGIDGGGGRSDGKGEGGASPYGPMPGTGGQTPNGPSNPTNSHIDITVTDTLAVIDLDILWKEALYNDTIQPAVVVGSSHMKGRMSVLSGATTWHSLAAAVPAMATDKKMYPIGTLPRDSRPERYGLPYTPDHRVSFMVDLLPFIGKGALRQSIQDKKFPWYAKENEAASTTWVPEFLVPYYPQSSWRATSPLMPNKSFGATNYVAISGLGLDSARYDPADPVLAKKVGITGYGWGSKPGEISDGMSNTIYMIQVPPGHQRPWIAGGGATVQGVDENVANPVSDFASVCPDKKRGTYALMADGSVRFIAESMRPEVFRAMATRAGGETLGNLDQTAPLVAPPKGLDAVLQGAAAAAITPIAPKVVEPKKEEPKPAEPKKDEKK